MQSFESDRMENATAHMHTTHDNTRTLSACTNENEAMCVCSEASGVEEAKKKKQKTNDLLSCSNMYIYIIIFV